jgi:hypothetical protein
MDLWNIFLTTFSNMRCGTYEACLPIIAVRIILLEIFWLYDSSFVLESFSMGFKPFAIAVLQVFGVKDIVIK